VAYIAESVVFSHLSNEQEEEEEEEVLIVCESVSDGQEPPAGVYAEE